MNKKTFVMLFVLVGMLASLMASPVYAAEPEEGCVSQDELTVVRYFSTPIIPIGEIVRFVKLCGSEELAVKYEEKVGTGVIVHYYQLSGVEISFWHYTNLGKDSGGDWVEPKAGDIGKVSYYGDNSNNIGKRTWKKDGFLDWMLIEEQRQWTPTEQALINYGNQFYQEAVEKQFFSLDFIGECGPDQLLLNGNPIQPGPYGYTYNVPENGGTLRGLYKKGICDRTTTSLSTWKVFVKPGDKLTTDSDYNIVAESMINPDPWSFCNELWSMRPQWQAEDIIPYEITEACPYLTDKYDESFQATLSHMGFLWEQDYGGAGYAGQPFVWAAARKINMNSWPAHKWERVDQIKLSSGDTYTATVYTENGYSDMPIPKLEGGYRTLWVEWNTPTVFVPNVSSENMTLHAFAWDETEVYRVVRASWNTAVVEKLVWK